MLPAPFVGLPGRTFQWVFDKRQVFGDSAAHLSLVSSGAAAVVAESNERLAALACDELSAALPAARAAQRCDGASSCASGARPSRWRPASRRVPTRERRWMGCCSPATGPKRACLRR